MFYRLPLMIALVAVAGCSHSIRDVRANVPADVTGAWFVMHESDDDAVVYCDRKFVDKGAPLCVRWSPPPPPPLVPPPPPLMPPPPPSSDSPTGQPH
jgi:hypothetical protein